VQGQHHRLTLTTHHAQERVAARGRHWGAHTILSGTSHGL
jgi:hypothetical protein